MQLAIEDYKEKTLLNQIWSFISLKQVTTFPIYSQFEVHMRIVIATLRLRITLLFCTRPHSTFHPSSSLMFVLSYRVLVLIFLEGGSAVTIERCKGYLENENPCDGILVKTTYVIGISYQESYSVASFK